jgi:hypothetical protein
MSIELGAAYPFTGVGAGQPLGNIAPHSHNLFIDFFRTFGVPGVTLIGIMVALMVFYMLASLFDTLFRSRGKLYAANDVMVLGSAVSLWNYIVANQMSDSFGPSTAAFLWLPAALLVAYRGFQKPVPVRPTLLPRQPRAAWWMRSYG